MNRTAAGAALALWALVAGAATVPAQPLLQERRAYSHAVELRHRFLREARNAPAERLKAAAQILAAPGDGDPYRPLARALAAVRGVECDAAFAFRAGLVLFAMPEIVDRATFTEIAVTVHAPYALTAAGAVKVGVQVADFSGKVVARARIDENTALDDLLRFRAVARIPVADLADGRYTVSAAIELDGAEPRPNDPELETTCHVLGGFKQRHDALLQQLAELDAGVSAEDRRLVEGAIAAVRRVHEGEPPYQQSRAVEQLQDAERVLANVAHQRAPLDGLRGWVTIGVPAGADCALVTLRLPLPKAEHAPLCLVVPGAPAHDGHSSRPTSPAFVPPEAMARELELARFDTERRVALAVMESPGRLPSAADSVAAVARALQQRFGLGGITVLGEREGAVAAALCARKHPGLLRGLGLVCGSAIGAELFARDDRPRVIAVPGTGHVSSENLERLRKAAPPDALVWLDDGGARPWPIALGLAARELAAFVQAAAGG